MIYAILETAQMHHWIQNVFTCDDVCFNYFTFVLRYIYHSHICMFISRKYILNIYLLDVLKLAQYKI